MHVSITFQIDIIGLSIRFILLKLAYYLLPETAAVVYSRSKKNYWVLVETMLLTISLRARFANQIFVWTWTCGVSKYCTQHELLPMKMQKHFQVH